MDEALELIAYQSSQIRERDEYIKALETMILALGIPLLLMAGTFVYLI